MSRRLVWCGERRFTLERVPHEPPSPGPGQVEVRVRAVGICGTDIHILNGHFPLARPPRVLGHEIAGDITAVGAGVTRLAIGDRVTVDSVVGCGECFFCRRGSAQFCTSGYELGITADGGCQDYLLVPERNVFPVGSQISWAEAAILDTEVWGAFRKCGVRPGETVLVIGHGPAGLIACQIARLMGAGCVILCGRSAARLEAARRLDIADRYVAPGDAPEGVDLAVDCAGTARSVEAAIRLVVPGGRVLLYGVHERPLAEFDLNQVVLKDLTVFGALSDRAGWEEVIGMVAGGRLRLAPLITHRFPMEDAPAAYSLVEGKRDGVIKAVLLF